MTLTFADTHNMIAYLTKSNASEGFNQIIDFLNVSSLKYALTVNPNIYVSCIKQFWIIVAVKKVNEVTRLQALVDKKKVIITEATIRDALRLDDAEGVECLTNEKIFAELARMGYEKPSTKLTFYKAKQVGDLSSHSTKYTSPSLTQKVFANVRRVGKGFFGLDTPLFEGMLVAHEVGEVADDLHAEDVNVAGVVAEGAASDDVNAVVDEPSIPSLTPPTPPPQPSQDIPSTSQPAKIQELVDVVTTAKIITEVVTAASTTITATDVPIPAAIIAAAPTLTVAPSRRRKGVVIRDPKESATTSTIIHSEAKSKDKGKRILKKEQMDEEDSRALKRLNESKKDKAAKKKKLDEEVEELKRHLQIVPNDDVYTEATPLALKVPVFDYEIYNQNNKPYYKIKRVNGSHQLYLSFLSLRRNFDREDLEALWRLVKERFATTKPKNFFDNHT
nr:xylulose kinase-1 [Tanacetum cinerariifolium]